MDMEFPKKSKTELMTEILNAAGYDLIKIAFIDAQNKLLLDEMTLDRSPNGLTQIVFTYSALEKILNLLNATQNAVVLSEPITFVGRSAYKKVNVQFATEVFVPLFDGSSRVAGIIYLARRGADAGLVRSDDYIGYMRLLIHMLERDLLCNRIEDGLEKTVLLLCEIINAKEPLLMANLYAVAHWAVRIARQMKLSEKDIRKLQLAALMHNLGKIYIDEQLLNKEEYTPEEEDLIKKRTVHSYEIALRLGKIYDLEDIPEIILRFQEHVDGSGYPGGLKGEAIPLLSRVLCVAKALTAMLAYKPSRRAMTLDEIIWDLKRNAGGMFDPRVSEAAQQLLINKKDEQTDYFSDMGTYATLSITTDWQAGSTIQLFGRIRRIKNIFVFTPVDKIPEINLAQISKCALYLDVNERILQFDVAIGQILTDRIFLSKVVPERVEDAFSVMWFMEGVFITNEKNIHRIYISLLGGDYLDFYIFNNENPSAFTSGIVKVSLGGGKPTYLPGIITFRQQMKDKVFFRFKYTNVSEAEREMVFSAMFKKQLDMRASAMTAGNLKPAQAERK